jgi:hypothetical protein
MVGLIRDLADSTPEVAAEEFEVWDAEEGYLDRWQQQLPELRVRVAQAIERYEVIRAAAGDGTTAR